MAAFDPIQPEFQGAFWVSRFLCIKIFVLSHFKIRSHGAAKMLPPVLRLSG